MAMKTLLSIVEAARSIDIITGLMPILHTIRKLVWRAHRTQASRTSEKEFTTKTWSCQMSISRTTRDHIPMRIIKRQTSTTVILSWRSNRQLALCLAACSKPQQLLPKFRQLLTAKISSIVSRVPLQLQETSATCFRRAIQCVWVEIL